MIGVIVMLAVFAAVYMSAYGSPDNGVAVAPVVIEKACPPHRWSRNAQDKHQCGICNSIFGANE